MNLRHFMNFVDSLDLKDSELENIKILCSDVPCSGKDFASVCKSYFVSDSSGSDFILLSGVDLFGVDNETN